MNRGCLKLWKKVGHPCDCEEAGKRRGKKKKHTRTRTHNSRMVVLFLMRKHIWKLKHTSLSLYILLGAWVQIFIISKQSQEIENFRKKEKHRTHTQRNPKTDHIDHWKVYFLVGPRFFLVHQHREFNLALPVLRMRERACVREWVRVRVASLFRASLFVLFCLVLPSITLCLFCPPSLP